MAGHGKSAIEGQTKASSRSGFKDHWGYFKTESIGLLKLCRKGKHSPYLFRVWKKNVSKLIPRRDEALLNH